MVSVWGEEVQVVLFPYSSGQYTSWVGNVASDCKYVPFELCRIIVSLIFTSWHSVYAEQAYNLLHHLSPRSDWLLISLHSITFKLNMKVMRTNEIITESNQSQMKSCYQFSDICPVCVDCVCYFNFQLYWSGECIFHFWSWRFRQTNTVSDLVRKFLDTKSKMIFSICCLTTYFKDILVLS